MFLPKTEIQKALRWTAEQHWVQITAQGDTRIYEKSVSPWKAVLVTGYTG